MTQATPAGHETQSDQVEDLEDVLDRIEQAARQQESVSLGEVVEHFGNRSFSPLLLLAGLITVTPIVGDVPGMPGIMGTLVILIVGQMLIGRTHLWLPAVLRRREISRDKLERGLGWMRKPARAVDRVLRPRLRVLTQGPGATCVALACLLIGIALWPLQLVPMAPNGAGLALTAFGLALVADDGVFALGAYLASFATLAAVLYALV
ncbi:MAG: exopolysaccharide biosynthesis protein [Pseudomonadota bacterium]|nr:exopolysaccharide biosynthesis protein [Pseudomonadota bacterium]